MNEQTAPKPSVSEVGAVRYELHKAFDGRCCVKCIEVVAIFESRDDARRWYPIDSEEGWA